MSRWFVVVLLTAGMLVGCTKRGKAVSHPMRYPVFAEPISLDRALSQDADAVLIHFHLHHGLTKFDTHGRLLPGIAERWEISADKKNYLFHLREAHWNDGAPITAENFRTSWFRLLTPTSPPVGADVLRVIEGAEDFRSGKTTDPSAIRVTTESARKLRLVLSQPDARLLEKLASPLFGPERGDTIAEFPQAHSEPDHLRTSGPFVVSRWERGSRIVLSPNPHFYGGKPNLRSVELVFLKDTASALVRYERGELDALVPVGASDRDRLKHSPEFLTTVIQRGFAPEATAPFEKLDILVKTGLAGFSIDRKAFPRFEVASWKIE